ncbi:Inhibitor of sigma-G Gin [Cohnella sp. OV330]|uniref:sigma factor G inhibitor Gin n=1 Tax=Cohnella sp. OV330 TaxID=1855288 RepID=UPI0008EDB81F|nr:sigma factor G inhibitor Gin [Cohnella sp. OV330]SFB60949.1 Inhibitor of sigma-G Gin [Cohnella sp. OV330]
MNEEDSKTCIVCGHRDREGIRIMSSFICHSCESEMVNTQVEDQRYPFFVQQLKQLWVHTEG